MDLSELIQLGERIGLEGSDLTAFVSEQQTKARDERKAQRDHERDLEQLKLNTATALAAANNNNSQSNNNTESSVEKLRLPVYEDKDDISCFLIRFERVCQLVQVPNDSYAARLGASLRGKAAEVYSSLPYEIASNYKRLKEALLLGFHKTVDNYRLDFRSTNALLKLSHSFQYLSNVSLIFG